jgi:hypothetical protein
MKTFEEIENFEQFKEEFKKVGLLGKFSESALMLIFEYLTNYEEEEKEYNEDYESYELKVNEIVEDWEEFESIEYYNKKYETNYKCFGDLLDYEEDNVSCIEETEKGFLISKF